MSRVLTLCKPKLPPRLQPKTPRGRNERIHRAACVTRGGLTAQLRTRYYDRAGWLTSSSRVAAGGGGDTAVYTDGGARSFAVLDRVEAPFLKAPTEAVDRVNAAGAAASVGAALSGFFDELG